MLARGPGKYESRKLTDIKYLVIHHTAVEMMGTGLEKCQSIAVYHTRSQGWPGIGYHYVIDYDGSTYQCNDLGTMSYNVASRNRECVGICLIGDFTNRPPSQKQIRAARALTDWLATQVDAQVVGHREVALPAYATACPGNAWPGWRWL